MRSAFLGVFSSSRTALSGVGERPARSRSCLAKASRSPSRRAASKTSAITRFESACSSGFSCGNCSIS